MKTFHLMLFVDAIRGGVVEAATFVSDRDRRDRYVSGRSLKATQYPAIVLVPAELRGLTLPLAGADAKSFELVREGHTP